MPLEQVEAAAVHGRAARTTRPRSPATTRETDAEEGRLDRRGPSPARPAVDLVKNFKWTNDDQNLVAKYIAEDGMSPEDAAAKWIDDNPDKVDAWLELSRSTPTAPLGVPATVSRPGRGA